MTPKEREDAAKLLELIGSSCPKTARDHDHVWWDCPRCAMIEELEQRGSLARRLLLSAAAALRAPAITGEAERRINTRCPSPPAVAGGDAPAVDVSALYHDLLYQVGKKHPGETRHETAKRYLRDHEDRCGQGGPRRAGPRRQEGQ